MTERPSEPMGRPRSCAASHPDSRVPDAGALAVEDDRDHGDREAEEEERREALPERRPEAEAVRSTGL